MILAFASVILIFILILIVYIIVTEKTPVIILGNTRFTVISPECIRIEYSKNGCFTDEPTMFAINRDALFTKFKTYKKNKKLVIETEKFILAYISNNKPLSAENLQVLIKNSKNDNYWVPGLKNMRNLGGTIRTLDCVRDEVDLGDGLLSRDGWYLYDDSNNHIFTDNWVKQNPNKNNIDWYLFVYNTDYKAALKSMTKIAGFVPLPRKYVLGAWYSRYWPYSSKDYREIVKEFKEHDFPLDVIVLDMDWHKEGWTGWSWNRNLFPDAEELLKWFHEQKLFVTLNVHPSDGVGPHEDMYEQFMKDLGEDTSTRKTIPFDAGNKRYLDILFKHTHIPLEKTGVDFWWLDWQQFEYTYSIPDLKNLKILNFYYYKHTQKNNKRGQSFSRWAGWGDHRYPIHFSGDAYTGWTMLKFEVPFTSTAGNIGCFFWSHDIGGHMGPRNEEIVARWVQFGSMTATLRLHSTRDENLDRRPWKYEKYIEDSIRISFHLRSVLFPYIYSSVWQCYKESVPLTRPMYIEYPENEKSYENQQQYFFGDHFIVAPIVSPGLGDGKVAKQKVWFPNGVWYNWFTGEKYLGDSEKIVTADINEFPLFVKGGIPIPTQNYTQRMTTEQLKEIVIRCYPGEENRLGKFLLYEDDGITTDYISGKYSLTEINYIRNSDIVKIIIYPAKGSYKNQLKKRSYVIELLCTNKCGSVKINNKFANCEYDKENFINRIHIKECSIRKKIVVELNVTEIDNNLIKKKSILKRIKSLLGVVPGITSVEEYFNKVDNELILERLLEIFGIVFEYNGSVITLYNDSDIVENNLFVVTVTDILNNNREVILKKECKIEKNTLYKIDLKELPLIQLPMGFVSLRTINLEFKIQKQNISISKIIDKKINYLSKWNLAGPFYFDVNIPLSEHNYEPEQKVINISACYKGLNDRIVSWQKAEPDNKNIIELKKYFDFGDVIVYAVTYLYSEKEQEVVFEIKCDSKFEIWLNNKKIYTCEDIRFFEYEPIKIKTVLKQGNNELLVKFGKVIWGWWSYRISIESQFPVDESYIKF